MSLQPRSHRFGVAPWPALVAAAALLTAEHGSAEAKEPADLAGATPVRVERAIAPALDMAIFETTLGSRDGPVSMWVFTTRGLEAFGHRELVLAVRRRERDAPTRYPGDVREFLRAVHAAAREGRHVSVGGRTSFSTSSGRFLDRTDVAGAIYTRVPAALEDVAGRDALLAVFLTRGEMDVAAACGHARVLALLGARDRHFPTPPWFDRDREEVVSPREVASSLVGRVPHIELSGTAAIMQLAGEPMRRVGRTAGLSDYEGTWQDGPVTLLLASDDVPRLAEALAKLQADAPFAMTLVVPPDVPRCMVWNYARLAAGQVTMISDETRRDDPRFAGNFVILAGGRTANEMRGLEDGFGFLLTDTDAARVRRALSTGDSLDIRDASGSTLLAIRPGP